MRVNIVHDWLFTRRGGEACWEEIRALYPAAKLAALFTREKKWPEEWRGLQVNASAWNRLPGLARYYRWLLPAYPLAVRSVHLPAADLTIAISHCAAKNVPVRSGKNICYCLTPARYLWDLRDEYLAVLPGSLRGLAGAQLDRLRAWDRAGADGVDGFIAISQTVAERIRRCYDRSARVVYPPVDTDYFTPDGTPPGDYYLFVAALVPYKRVDLALAACRQLGRKLVVVGDGPERRQLTGAIPPDTIWHRGVTRAELRALYRGCRAVIFPVHEDFGIVPVEANACGRPVVTLARGGATETQTADSGVRFAEATAAALVEALRELEGRDWRPDAARAAAERFSTARFRREFMTAMAEAHGA